MDPLKEHKHIRNYLIFNIAILTLIAIGSLFMLYQKIYMIPLRELRSAKSVEIDSIHEIMHAIPDERGKVTMRDVLIPEGTPDYYTVVLPYTNSYYYDNDHSEIAEVLAGGTHIDVLNKDNEYYQYKMADGSNAYVSSLDLERGVLYASYENATDLRSVLKNAVYDLRFASENNLTGHSMYPAIPLLETSTAQMLAEAEKILNQC